MVTMRFRLIFFDPQRVIRAMDKATRRSLMRAGAFIRRTAKTSIRKRKGASKPGKPPHSHIGHLRRLLYFAYDPAIPSVVIGPAKWRFGEAPNLLEFGGTQSRRRGRKVIRRRPFMGPAYKKELPKLPRRWRNAIIGP